MRKDDILVASIEEKENPNSLLVNPQKKTETESEEVEKSETITDEKSVENIDVDEENSTDTSDNEQNILKEKVKTDITYIKEQVLINAETEVTGWKQASNNNTSPYFILGGVVFVVIILICALLLLKKRKNGNMQGVEEKLITISPGATGNKAVKLMNTAKECPVKIVSVHDVGRRSMQQDSFGTSDIEGEVDFEKKGVLAIVADGMGGLSDGERMSQLVVVTMLQGFDEDDGSMPSASLLMKLVYDANVAVNKELGEEKIGKCGSTLTAVIVKNRKLSWISVGDSHIYVCREGKLIKMNEDHNYAKELDERVKSGELTLEEAMKDPQRGALTSFIGMGELEMLDQNENPIALEKNDRILLMSDGVFGTVAESRIAEIMNMPLLQAGEQLEQEIRQKNKRNQDNYTCVILQVN